MAGYKDQKNHVVDTAYNSAESFGTRISLTIQHFTLFTNQNDLESLAFSVIFQVVSCTRTINLRTQTKAFTSIKKKIKQ